VKEWQGGSDIFKEAINLAEKIAGKSRNPIFKNQTNSNLQNSKFQIYKGSELRLLIFKYCLCVFILGFGVCDLDFV
jgi:hypothetical protein